MFAVIDKPTVFTRDAAKASVNEVLAGR